MYIYNYIYMSMLTRVYDFEIQQTTHKWPEIHRISRIPLPHFLNGAPSRASDSVQLPNLCG